MKRTIKNVLILLMMGTFVSATQGALARMASPDVNLDDEFRQIETCFSETGMLDLTLLLAESETIPSLGGGLFETGAADTLETYEIELEDEGKKGVNYKAIIGLTIVAVFVGYALYIFLVPDEEEATDDGGGKELPVSFIRIPFGD